VRTFIVGDDIAEASASVRARIERLSDLASEKRRNRAGEIGSLLTMWSPSVMDPVISYFALPFQISPAAARTSVTLHPNQARCATQVG
jgi:K+-transporting ATPase c subunit